MLENSYPSRYLRESDRFEKYIEKITAEDVTDLEIKIIAYLFNNKTITVREATKIIDKSSVYTRKTLKKLVEKKYIEWHGLSLKDPTQYYSLIKNIDSSNS